MLFSIRKLLWVPVLVIFLGTVDDSKCHSQSESTSENFTVRSFDGGPRAAEILLQCEQVRTELRRLWLGVVERVDWQPRCEIILHPTRTHYSQAVGRHSGQTSGSSLIRFEQNRISGRRVDLLVDQTGHLTALAHELSHVVLADRFEGSLPPRWLDEGIATMADSIAKRTLHHRDCDHAVRSGTALPLAELLRLEQFATVEEIAAFYGQSLSLIHFLVEQKEPEIIVKFVETAVVRGYDCALQEHYDMESVAELERNWLAYVRTINRSERGVSPQESPAQSTAG